MSQYRTLQTELAYPGPPDRVGLARPPERAAERGFGPRTVLGAVPDGPLTFLEHTGASATGTDRILARMGQPGPERCATRTGRGSTRNSLPGAFAGSVYDRIDGGGGSSTTEIAGIAHANGQGVSVGEKDRRENPVTSCQNHV